MKQEDFFKRYTYSIRQDKIGGGAFGTVYRAHDNLLHRDVAIKVSEVKVIGNKEFTLRDEFLAINNLPSHPNIANYEALYTFESPQGIFDYALMQYYPDGNLSKVIKDGLKDQQKEQVAIQLLEGLCHLHQHKVVHRDLKPGNILIVKRGERIIPLITDFGLSKQAFVGEQSRFSNSFGGGTLKYSSPEQLRGEELRLNTDLWAYGVIVYEIFTSKALFNAEGFGSASAEAEEEIFKQIKGKDISAEIQQLPEEWQKAVSLCLVREPAERIKSAAQLLELIKNPQASSSPSSTIETTQIDPTQTSEFKHSTPDSTKVEASEPLGVQADKTKVEPSTTPQPPKKPSPTPPRKSRTLWYVLAFMVLASIIAAVLFLGEEKKEVQIVSTPSGARLSIDGQSCGTTPWIGELVFGNHNIKLVNGKKTMVKQISISEVGQSSFSYDVRIGKEITINSNPSGLNLSIDGKSFGTTPWAGTLAFGSHNIKLQNGKKTVNKQISVSDGGQSSFSYDVSEFGENFTETVNGVSFTMVAVKGGCFQMGSNDGGSDEKPVHEVCLDDYYIGRTEVTQALWKAVMNNNPSNFKGDKLPVELVSWDDAQEFVKKLNRMTGKEFRLPTEAEWEYAAVSAPLNNRSPYKYAGSNNINEVAWYSGNSGSKTHPVAQKKANAFGLYDMSGNVYEWCQDWYDSDYYKNSPRHNPQGPSSGSIRVRRGGSWGYSAFFFRAYRCRSAYRNPDTPGYRRNDIGFRLVSPK